MERRKRIEYLAVTATMFVSVVLLFYFMGAFQSSVPVENERRFRIEGSLSMGYLFTGILSGVMLAAGFFAKRSFKFKVLAAAAWIITLFAVFIAGEFMLIPYQIYNLIQIIRSRPAKEEMEREEPPEEEEKHAD